MSEIAKPVISFYGAGPGSQEIPRRPNGSIDLHAYNSIDSTGGAGYRWKVYFPTCYGGAKLVRPIVPYGTEGARLTFVVPEIEGEGPNALVKVEIELYMFTREGTYVDSVSCWMAPAVALKPIDEEEDEDEPEPDPEAYHLSDLLEYLDQQFEAALIELDSAANLIEALQRQLLNLTRKLNSERDIAIPDFY